MFSKPSTTAATSSPLSGGERSQAGRFSCRASETEVVTTSLGQHRTAWFHAGVGLQRWRFLATRSKASETGGKATHICSSGSKPIGLKPTGKNHKQSNKQTNKQASKQASKQTNKQTNKHHTS